MVEVCPAGRIPAGTTDIPFELPLRPKPNRTLYETYHGVFVNISYTLRCEMKRSFLSKDFVKVQQFMVQYKVFTSYSKFFAVNYERGFAYIIHLFIFMNEGNLMLQSR